MTLRQKPLRRAVSNSESAICFISAEGLSIESDIIYTLQAETDLSGFEQVQSLPVKNQLQIPGSRSSSSRWSARPGFPERHCCDKYECVHAGGSAVGKLESASE